MPEIIHNGEQVESIVEKHLGRVLDTRHELVSILLHNTRFGEAPGMQAVDAMLDKLIEHSRSYSGFATLYLRRVKEGRL
jgi:hypothetical protein